MTVRRGFALLAAAAGVAPFLLAGPAAAHGAPDSPVSRAAACGPLGRTTSGSAACRAAVAAGDAVEQWDNIRVANVAGRDRELIPDGKLCSGGLANFKGLDLPRADWPATKVTAGAAFTFSYRTTIPHRGSFQWYVTKPGYDPTRRLAWSDLESRPFLTATDPPVVGGAYRMKGRLPAGRTGRHVIFAIWRNTSTPDTYYSCSDVVFSAPAAPRAANPAPAHTGASPTGAPVTTGAAAPTGSATGSPPAPVAAAVTSHRSGGPLLAAGGAVLAAVVLVLAGGWLRSRRAAAGANDRAGRRRFDG
jgi:predicted carbohydrate-binding protein with CBM5 and CBM33 domain